jgi:predicted GNAT family N-acyltransferase
MTGPSRKGVLLVGWDEAAEPIARVRREVFIEEQGVPEALEWDEWDAPAVHALVLDGGEPVATGRLLPDGRIGRMAVVRAWRGRGLGAAVLHRLLALARARGLEEVVLSAQVQAMPFYAKAGFVAEGPGYDDAGIPHRTMRLRLPPREQGAGRDGS